MSYILQLVLLTLLAVTSESQSVTVLEVVVWMICICDSVHDIMVYRKLQFLFPVSAESFGKAVITYVKSNLWRTLDLLFLLLLPPLVVTGCLRHNEHIREVYRSLLSLCCVTAYLKIMPMMLMHRTFGPLQVGTRVYVYSLL